MKRQNLRTVSLIVGTFTYLLIGAAIFGYLEADHESQQRSHLELIERTVKRRYNMSEDDFTVLSTAVIKSVPHKAGIQWRFPGAFYFATTVVTTIGYGHSTPATRAGRSFCMIYALIGIPLGLVMFQCIGERLNTFVGCSLRYVKRCFGCRDTEVSQTNLVMVVLVLSTILMSSMAGVFAQYERWDYFDALYYCFITLTTIGFGDFVALQTESALQSKPEYVALSLIFILFGLSVVSSAVNLLVLKFLTLNTEDERRDEQLRSSANQAPIQLVAGQLVTARAPQAAPKPARAALGSRPGAQQARTALGSVSAGADPLEPATASRQLRLLRHAHCHGSPRPSPPCSPAAGQCQLLAPGVGRALSPEPVSAAACLWRNPCDCLEGPSSSAASFSLALDCAQSPLHPARPRPLRHERQQYLQQEQRYQQQHYQQPHSRPQHQQRRARSQRRHRHRHRHANHRQPAYLHQRQHQHHQSSASSAQLLQSARPPEVWRAQPEVCCSHLLAHLQLGPAALGAPGTRGRGRAPGLRAPSGGSSSSTTNSGSCCSLNRKPESLARDSASAYFIRANKGPVQTNSSAATVSNSELSVLTLAAYSSPALDSLRFAQPTNQNHNQPQPNRNQPITRLVCRCCCQHSECLEQASIQHYAQLGGSQPTRLTNQEENQPNQDQIFSIGSRNSLAITSSLPPNHQPTLRRRSASANSE